MKTRLFCIFLLLNSFYTITAQDNHGSLKPEKVFLHTDRNIYVAGESLFYTLYLHGNKGQMSKYAYLVIRDHKNSHVTDLRLEINNSIAYGSIYLSDTLSSGIYQIVCYTNCMRNNSEESYFTKEIVIANRFDETMDRISESETNVQSVKSAGGSSNSDYTGNLKITLDKKVYSPREKISFSIQIMNLAENSISHLSAAVSEITPGVSFGKSISEYFNDNKSLPEKSAPNQSACKYFSEINGTVLQGRVLVSTENISQGDSSTVGSRQTDNRYTILVSTPDTLVNMQFTRTDSSGAYSFLLNPFYDGRELIIRLKESVKATLIPDNKFSLKSVYNPSHLFNVPGIKASLIRCGKIAQIRKTYNARETIKTEKEFFPALTIPRLYYNHFTSIYPSDFVSLNDFAEMSKEIIPALRLRKSHDKYIAEFPILQYSAQEESVPAIFLDGVPIDDISQVITFGSDQIKRIELLPEIRYYGDISFAGILAIFSRDMRINNIPFINTVLKLDALSSQSYTRPEPFVPAENSKHYPDLRQLLLWEPDLALNRTNSQQIDFYASDLTGRFRIDIQGIASDGTPIYGSAIITIQSKQN